MATSEGKSDDAALETWGQWEGYAARKLEFARTRGFAAG
jgi:hypothetical protein